MIGLPRGDGYVARRNDQHTAPSHVRKGVDLIATANPHSAPAEEKEGDIRAKSSGDLCQTSSLNGLARQPQQTDQRCCRVARSPSQAASYGNALGQDSADASLDAQLPHQLMDRPVDQVIVPGLRRQSRISGDAQVNVGTSLHFELQRIVKRNRLEDGAKLVVTVRAASDNVERQIYFCKGWDADWTTGWVCYYGLVSEGDFCCAMRRFSAAIFCSTSASLAGSKSPGSTRCHSSSDLCN